MSPEIIGLIGIVAMLALFCTGMWIGLAMGVVGFIGVVLIRGFDLGLIMAGDVPFSAISYYPITVMPMFIIMGYVIAGTGIGADLYHAAYKLVGQVRGGLASATVFACAMLAAMVGGSNTGIVVMSRVALPEMKKRGYDESLSSGVIACASTMGILIPPSIALILYGILTEQSIGRLFMAGLIPGIMEAVFYMIAIYIMCRISPRLGPPGPKTTIKEKVFSLKGIWPMIVLFSLVMGGIYGGLFTPTEAGAVGAFGAIIIAAVMRRINFKGFIGSMRESGVMIGMMLLMIAGTFIFQHFVAISRLPQAIGVWVAALGFPDMVIMIAIVIMYIILGMFIPAFPMVLLTIPIIYPVTVQMGFDPIWFGIIVVRVLEIGSVSPPVGTNVFLLSGISGISLSTIYRGAIPFIIADLVHVAVLIAIPGLSLFLPNMMR